MICEFSVCGFFYFIFRIQSWMKKSVTFVTSLIGCLNGSRCIDYSGTSKTLHYFSGFLSWCCNETEGSCFSHLGHC
ncbi:hypothetical protein WN943_010507 [Citrus x changshan-huyou]